MARDLSILIEGLGAAAWYPLADITEDGAVTEVTDESGNERDLLPTSIYPDAYTYIADSVNGRPSIQMNEEAPAYYDEPTTFAVRDIFTVAKWTGGATFTGNERGLLSDAATNPLLVGANGTTKFINLGLGGATVYEKSKTSYSAADQQAPMSDFELVHLSNTSGWSLDGIILGQDRSDPTRRWIGNAAELLMFPAVQDALTKRRIELYFDLKFGLWQLNDTVIDFPSQEITGILYNRFYEFPKSWAEATDSHEYEDLGRSFNLAADDVPVRWEIGFTGLTPGEANVFEEFYDQVKHHNTFNFLDKYGVTHTGVRVEMGEFQRTHDAHKSWIVNCGFRLVKYP